MTNSSFSPDRQLRPLARSAAQDLIQGLARWRISGRLGWLEVKRRYRRTIIGPFWSAISLTMFVIALGSVGVGLWNQGAAEYIPFLAAGLVVWIMISTVITESCNMFIMGQNLFRQMQFDYSILAYALVWRNFVVFLHNLVVYLAAVLLLSRHLLDPVLLLAIPGILLVLMNGVWVALLLGLLCLRFRDLQQLITNVTQVAIFVTPIFWPPDLLRDTKRLVFVSLNPLYHMIDIVRAPLLGRVPSSETYFAVLIITIVGWIVTYLFFQQFRKRIAYWS